MDGTLLWRRNGESPHRILTEIDDEDDEKSDHRDLDQVSINDIIVAEPDNEWKLEMKSRMYMTKLNTTILLPQTWVSIWKVNV